MTCKVCDWADEHGSWVDCPAHDGLTHCRGCHASWPRVSEYQHCTSCHRTFSNVRAADLHRDDRWRCLDPATLRDRHDRPKLGLSSRKLRAGSTVALWVRAAGPQSHHWADSGASEGLRQPEAAVGAEILSVE